MKKINLKIIGCILALTSVAILSTTIVQSKGNHFSASVEKNYEALSAKIEEDGGGGSNYRYPEAKGKAQFCKLYVYIKGGVVVSKGTEENPLYEGNAQYEKSIKEGLKDRCPDDGKGCNPYSCQEVPY